MPSPSEINFDDDSQPVGTVDFDFGAVEREPEAAAHEEAARMRQETTLRLLQFLTTKATAKQAGQRLHMLAFLLHASDCRTQRDLARRLRLTPGRVSQALNSAKREFAMLARL